MIDKELEDAIDRVGRDRVFAKAEEMGWPRGSSPDKWIWWEIVRGFEDLPSSPQAAAAGGGFDPYNP